MTTLLNPPSMAVPQSAFSNMDEKGQRPREGRENGRGGRNGANSHYRRARSPHSDEFDEPISPSSDVKLEDARAILAQSQNQQRVVPITTSQLARNPVQRKPQPRGSQDRGNPGQTSPSKSQPPAYPAQQFEDSPRNQGGDPARYGHYRRSNTGPARSHRHTGSDPSLPPSGPQHQSSGSGSGSPTRPTQQRRAQSMITDTQPRRSPSPLSDVGGSINRINSPTIGKTVLLPLEQKIHEYDRLMEEAQTQMMQLDEEIRQMQERRRQAEDRFVEAKGKHDEYERQHQDVGRALRGELERMRTPRPMPRMDSIDTFGERPGTGQSSKMGNKMRARDRLRMSIFKG